MENKVYGNVPTVVLWNTYTHTYTYNKSVVNLSIKWGLKLFSVLSNTKAEGKYY